MLSDNAAIAEYSALRSELTAIIIVRYTLLTVAITLTVTALGVAAILQLRLKTFCEALPSIIGALLLPTLWITRDLTRRFSRICTYRDARFELASPGFGFQRSWRQFQNRGGVTYAGYRGIVVAYLFLAVAGFAFAGVADSQSGALQSCADLSLYYGQIAAWTIVLGSLIWQTYMARSEEEKQRGIWETIVRDLKIGLKEGVQE